MKHLVLIGGGHAHLAVLKDIAERPLLGWKVSLVTPFRRQIYSGMLPGWIAGFYDIDECAIALDALASRGSVELHLNACLGLDLTRNRVVCADGTQIAFDLLSIDSGPEPALDSLPGAHAYALPIRPIEGFVKAWPAMAARIAAQSHAFDLVVLGGGAAGVELTLGIQRQAQMKGWAHLRITLIGSDTLPLQGVPERARRQMADLLTLRGIRWLGQRRATRIGPDQIDFAKHDVLRFDGCMAVTGAAAPAWPAAAGLATDERGFIRVGATLQSVSHPHVFAAGDVAAYLQPRPKSGVFAVRAGPILVKNLRALCMGASLQAWTPQQRALYLVSTADECAVAIWGALSWRGAWVWHWKDRIDRQFVARFGADGAKPS